MHNYITGIVILVAMMLIVWMIFIPNTEKFPGFQIDGYPLGSYDPNMYYSEIVRN